MHLVLCDLPVFPHIRTLFTLLRYPPPAGFPPRLVHAPIIHTIAYPPQSIFSLSLLQYRPLSSCNALSVSLSIVIPHFIVCFFFLCLGSRPLSAPCTLYLY